MNVVRTSMSLLAALLLCAPAHAALQGQSFSASYRLPDIDTPYPGASFAPSSFVVGAGIESLANVEDVTFISIDFSDTALSLVLNTTLAQPTWNSFGFNGLVFDLASSGPLGITGASIGAQTSMIGFDASRVTFDNGRIAIDWGGLSYVDGTRVVVDFATAVPEPQTYALMLAGLGMLGAAAARRRKNGSA